MMKTWTPQALNDLGKAFRQSAVLLTAIELDLFTPLGRESLTVEALAGQINVPPRRLRILLDALVGMELLDRTGKTYRALESAARLLNHESDLAAMFKHQAQLYRSWSHVTEVIKTDTPLKGAGGGTDAGLKIFHQALAKRGLGSAAELAQVLGRDSIRRLMDLGGGAGAYVQGILEANSQAEGLLVDTPEVLPLAKEWFERAGLSHRAKTLAADLLKDELPEGYDTILVSSVVHIYDPQTNRELIKKCHRALAPGGRLVIKEITTNTAHTGPLEALLFGVNMAVNTETGDVYSGAEIAEWMKEAGFASTESRKLPSQPETEIIIGTKAPT